MGSRAASGTTLSSVFVAAAATVFWLSGPGLVAVFKFAPRPRHSLRSSLFVQSARILCLALDLTSCRVNFEISGVARARLMAFTLSPSNRSQVQTLSRLC